MLVEHKAGRADVAIRFSDQALVSIGNFGLGLLVARALTPAQFGTYALFWSIVMFALSTQWAFIVSPMQFSLPKADAVARKQLCGALLSHSLVIGTLGGLTASAVFYFASGGLPSTAIDFAIIAASFVCLVAQDFARRWLLVTERPRLALASDAIRHAGATAAIALTHLVHGLSASQCIGLIGAASLAGSLPVWREVRAGGFEWRNTLTHAARHAEAGKWLLPFVVLQSVIASAPIYALSAIVDTAAAGGYRAALYLMAPIVSLTEALETFLPLRASQVMASAGAAALWRYLWRCAWPIWLGCLAFVSIVCLLAADLLRLTFGPAYVGFEPLLLPLAIAMLLQFGTYILNVLLRAAGQSRPVLTAELFAGATLLLAYIAIPLGPVGQGAALCAAGAQGAKLLALILSAKRFTRAHVKSESSTES